jgi:hypothetical protein
MQHYVCTGDCGNENSKPGVCETEGCTKEGQALNECHCEDGFHEKVITVVDEPDVEKMDDEDAL